MNAQSLKHPRALWSLTACYSLFMAGTGCIFASTVLYATRALHMPTNSAYGVFAAMMALFWIAPLVGGYVASQLGYMMSTLVGLLFATAGMAVLSVPTVDALDMGLALFVVGNAFLTPALWCMIDFAYAKDDHRREAGFTLFYLFFNVGAVLGIFVGGALADHFSFSVEFLVASICLLLGFLVLLVQKNTVKAHKGRSIARQVSWSFPKALAALLLLCVVMTPVSLLLFKNANFNNLLMAVLFVGVVVYLFWKARHTTTAARKKLTAFLFLSIASIAFWTLYTLEPSFLSVFVSTNVDRHFLGMNIPAESFFAFDGVFVILLGLLLSRVWFYLSMRGSNPSLVTKFSSALLIIGLGFGLLGLLVLFHGDATPFPAWGVVLAYAVFASAELLVGPLGISMVGSLSPPGMEGLLMGFWQLCMGFGGVVAGYIAMAPNLPDSPLPLATSNPLYIRVFLLVGGGAIIAGLCTVLCSKVFAKVMVEHEQLLPQL